MALHDSPDQGVKVVGWESPDGRYHAVYDIDDKKVGREPSDRQMEGARRVVLKDPETGEYHTIAKVTPRLDLDRVIQRIRDHYKELGKRR
jgi:formylmethanofuran:tetrahydromethanopterin formyltransferase